MEKSVIGIDAALANTGLGAVGEDGFMMTHTIVTNSSHSLVDRFNKIRVELRDFIDQVSELTDLRYVIVEMPSHIETFNGKRINFVSQRNYILGVGVVIMGVLCSGQYYEVILSDAPYGRTGLATKNKAKAFLKTRYPINDSMNSHEVDALFLADWWLDRCIIEGNCKIETTVKAKRHSKKKKRR